MPTETVPETADLKTPPERRGDILGYARVSTGEQNPDAQRDRLTEAGAIRVFTDVASGTRSDRPGLAELIDHARPGDRLCVIRLDRLGRSRSAPSPSASQSAARSAAGAIASSRTPRCPCARRSASRQVDGGNAANAATAIATRTSVLVVRLAVRLLRQRLVRRRVRRIPSPVSLRRHQPGAMVPEPVTPPQAPEGHVRGRFLSCSVRTPRLPRVLRHARKRALPCGPHRLSREPSHEEIRARRPGRHPDLVVQSAGGARSRCGVHSDRRGARRRRERDHPRVRHVRDDGARGASGSQSAYRRCGALCGAGRSIPKRLSGAGDPGPRSGPR